MIGDTVNGKDNKEEKTKESADIRMYHFHVYMANENCAAVEEVCKFLCWLKRTFQLPLCQVSLAATSYKEWSRQKEMGQNWLSV